VFIDELTGSLITGSYLCDIAMTLLGARGSVLLRLRCESPISDAIIDEHLDSLPYEIRSRVTNATPLAAGTAKSPVIKPSHTGSVPLAGVQSDTRNLILFEVIAYALTLPKRSVSRHPLWMLNTRPLCPDMARILLSVSREFKVRSVIVIETFLTHSSVVR